MNRGEEIGEKSSTNNITNRFNDTGERQTEKQSLIHSIVNMLSAALSCLIRRSFVYNIELTIGKKMRFPTLGVRFVYRSF